MRKILYAFMIGLAAMATLIACEPKAQNNTENVLEDNRTDMPSNELDFIFPKGNKGPKELFTGNAYNYGLVPNDSIYNTLVGNVYFEPGARSNWHLHPSGQLLIITDGLGYHQIKGQPIEVIKKGDVITCPPNVLHWHGASKDTGLQQLYIVPNTEKGIVDWKEAVSDDIYDKVAP